MQMPRAYNFKPGLAGFQADAYTKEVEERDAFAWMLHLMETQCRHNPNLRLQPRRKTKDVIHRNKVRESYLWNP